MRPGGANFVKFGAATMGISLGIGYACMWYVERRNPSAAADTRSCGASISAAVPSRDEALVRAMIQNAKESSWKENLTNAIHGTGAIRFARTTSRARTEQWGTR